MPSDVRARLATSRLYLCTDARRDRGDLAGFLDAVLAGGVDAVQLREKNLEAADEMELAISFEKAARKHDALWSVNDRADLAFALQPDILHLGQDDLPTQVARAIVGHDMLIGRSTHSRAEIDAAAAEEGVDYFCVGPVWPTPTKPGRPAPGLDLIRYAAALDTNRPWFAIGGIDLDNLDKVIDAGATRVVVVRAITDAADPAGAAQEFTQRLDALPAGGRC